MENKELTVKQIQSKLKMCEGKLSEYNSLLTRYENELKEIEEGTKKAYTSPSYYKTSIRDFKKKINKYEALIAEYNGMLVGKVKEYPVVRQYVETWKKNCIDYITDPQTIGDCIESYNSMRKHQEEVEADYKARGYKSWESYNARKDIEKSFLRTWGFVYEYLSMYNKTIDMERLERDYKYEADRKYNKFIEDAEYYVGEITAISGLSIGRNGDLNGFVVGTKGKAEVNTIAAEGPIQRFHYRTLFKMAK